jgi:cutinase
MTDVTFLRMSSRLAAITSALVCAATTLAIAPSATADPCSDIKVIFARGTNDAPGLGNPGQAFADALSTLVGGRSLTTYGVNYPASYDFLLAADGAAMPPTASMAADCPSTRIVLEDIHREPRRRHARLYPAARQQDR